MKTIFIEIRVANLFIVEPFLNKWSYQCVDRKKLFKSLKINLPTGTLFVHSEQIEEKQKLLMI